MSRVLGSIPPRGQVGGGWRIVPREDRRWYAALAGLCAVRVAVPLAALVASPGDLPGLPRYVYEPTPGDAQGFYSAAREFIASWGRLGAPAVLAGAVALLAVAFWAVRTWRARPSARGWVVVVLAVAFSLAVVAAITQISRHTGAAVFGWPLLWALPMLPYRALGGPLDPDVAFGFGLALSLVANVGTVVAVWFIGLRATRRRSVALTAAAFFALWPILSGLVSGELGWTNGTWHVDAGLHLYDEPISTALVAAAVAIVLGELLGPVALVGAGGLLGLATVVRLSNGLLAALVLGLLAAKVGPRRALPFLAGGLAFAPIVVAWWPRGYAALFDRPDIWPPHPFSADYVVRNWTESLFFSSRAVLVLVPLALLGAYALRGRFALALLGGIVLVNAAFYSFYANTAEHPRFLHVALPAVLVLWAAGAAGLALGLRKTLQGRGERRRKPTMIGS